MVRHTRKGTTGRPTAGFSLIEMMFVVVIIGIVAAMAVYSIVGALPNIKVNGGVNTAAGVLKSGKYLAVSQRRNYQLMFAGNKQLWLRRLEVPAGFTDQPVVTLPGNVTFALLPGIPDTPDGFGNCGAVCFGGTLTQTFMSNDTFVDTAGAPLNGTMFLAIGVDTATQRAITISGATGRIRAYRWNGAAWLEF
jgi:prepilin-type N-terminal cleavage/methylation domain-containing protein